MDADSCLAENAALKRKLESKVQALLILTQELNKCRQERDHFKLIADQSRHSALSQTSLEEDGMKSDCYDLLVSNNHLKTTEKENKTLRFELADLKQKLREALGDIKVLRKEKSDRSKDQRFTANNNWHEREELIQELEETKASVKELQNDLQSVIDEKEELVTERDAYRCKVHRLNHQMSVLLKGSSAIDIDSLVMENKYLKERLEHALDEKDMLQQTLCKYKLMLDKRKTRGSVKLGASDSCGGMVVTHKQVQELLEKSSVWEMPSNEATMADLRSLCIALLEALQDKSLALTHQRKANKILANRVTDLEASVSKSGPGLLCPSQILLEGYAGSQVDKDMEGVDIEEGSEEADKKTINCDSQNTRTISDEFIPNSGDSEDALPPELEALVLKAMSEIENS